MSAMDSAKNFVLYLIIKGVIMFSSKFPSVVSSFIKNSWLFIWLISSSAFSQSNPIPDVQLASVYSDSIDVKDYFVSEKYDGIRAIWTGKSLITRKGNPIHAPDWFTNKLPEVWLDGELWSKRNDFEYLVSTVRKKHPIDSEWKRVHYMVFDAPDKTQSLSFEVRYERYSTLIDELNLPHVIAIKQFTVANNALLDKLLIDYVNAGAEGLILHRKLALFESGRTDNLLKLKPHMDAEAKVVDVLGGKGKYEGVMGSLLVEMPSGLRFKIGTGFSDKERKAPPQLGEYVTYKYHGLTERGVPRFASFLRVRDIVY